jgi:ABC-2 type transport system permease protein
LFAAYFLLGYMMYGALMFAVGISVNAEQESRQLGGVVGIVTVLPFFFMFLYLRDPNGPLPVFFSLFPLTAPSGMLLRYAWANVPPGQVALSLVLLAAFIFIELRFAAFVFRLGALNYGRRLGIRDLIANRGYGARQA